MREALEHLKRTVAFKALLDKLASRRARAGGLTPAAASLLSVVLAQTTGRETLLVIPPIDATANLH